MAGPLERLWHKPVTVTTLILIIYVLVYVSLANAKLGPNGNDEGQIYSVLIEHYGVDSREMERSITKPLEDALASIEGLRSMRSVSDFGTSRVTIYLRDGISPKSAYLQLRDSVDRVYARLPASVQRPQIFGGAESSRAIYIASVTSGKLSHDDLGTEIIREIKPGFEKIDGVSEVLVEGNALREIHVKLDSNHAAQAGINASLVASTIQGSDIFLPVGKLTISGIESAITISGRIGSIQKLEALQIPTKSGSLPLSAFAEVKYGSRERLSISRVNGVESIVLVIKATGTANLVALSKAINAEASRWERTGTSFEMILDTGKKLQISIAEIIKAIVLSLLSSAIMLPIFMRNVRRIIAIALTVPAIGLACAASLSALGFSLDAYVLSGLAIGIGVIIDTGIILAMQCETGIYGKSIFPAVNAIIPSLLAGSLTALMALLPLIIGNPGGHAVGELAITLSIVVGLSFLLICILLPPFLSSRKSSSSTVEWILPWKLNLQVTKRIELFMNRLIMLIINAKRIPILAGIAISACGLWAVLTLGIDFDPPPETGTIQVHVEFKSGTSLREVDSQLVKFIAEIKHLKGVNAVQSTAKTGSGEIETAFDSKVITRDVLSQKILTMKDFLPGGFIYLPQGSGKKERMVEIAVTGDEHEMLHSIAGQAAQVLSGKPEILQTVLNFKEPADSFIFAVDPIKAADRGTNAASVADALRWHLYGPVALKWVSEGKEDDLRVMGPKSNETVLTLAQAALVNNEGTSAILGSVGNFSPEKSTGRLYRSNRQAAAYLTAHIAGGDIVAIVEGVKKALSSVRLPPGYAFDVGGNLNEQANRFGKLAIACVFCFLLVYIILGMLTESFFWPLIIIASIPPAVSLPLIALKISGQHLILPVLIGLIILIGLAANNAILIAEAYRRKKERDRSAIAQAVLARLRGLTASTVASILGLMPLMVAGGEDALFMRSLAFAMFFGLSGSFLSSIFIVPALLAIVGNKAEKRQATEAIVS